MIHDDIFSLVSSAIDHLINDSEQVFNTKMRFDVNTFFDS